MESLEQFLSARLPDAPPPDELRRTLERPEVLSLHEAHGGAAVLCCAPEAELLWMATEPPGCGHGTRLLQRLLTELRLRGVHTLFIEVRAGNAAALRLYLKSGAHAYGRRRGYYSDPAEDAVLLRAEF